MVRVSQAVSEYTVRVRLADRSRNRDDARIMKRKVDEAFVTAVCGRLFLIRFEPD